MLRPFHTRLRREIERVGGTLDKLIGDAVMAVVGIPAVHEDDPERAAFNFGLLEDFDTCTGTASCWTTWRASRSTPAHGFAGWLLG